MNLKIFKNQELITELKKKVAEERKLTAEILHFLKEVELRRIHLEMGYSSLFDFTMNHLGYSEPAAHRRIQSMRLLKEIPEIETKITTGELSLTNLAQVAMTLKSVEKKEERKIPVTEKRDLLKQVENKSKKECERLLIAQHPEALKSTQEKERVLTQDLTEIKLILPNRVLEKLKRLKNLRSHVNPNASYLELIEDLADLALKKLDPGSKNTRVNQTPTPAEEKARSTMSNEKRSVTPAQFSINRTIPTHLKKQIWVRDQGRCTYQNTHTGKTCNSQFQIQFEHLKPFGLGGKHSLENLTLRCRAHNLLSAVQSYGERKIYSHVQRK